MNECTPHSVEVLLKILTAFNFMGGGRRCVVQKWKAAAFKVFIQPHEFAFMHPLHAAAAGYHAEQCRYEIIKNDSWLLNKMHFRGGAQRRVRVLSVYGSNIHCKPIQIIDGGAG